MRDLLNIDPDVLNKEENYRDYVDGLQQASRWISEPYETSPDYSDASVLERCLQNTRREVEAVEHDDPYRCYALGRYHAYRDRVSKLTGLKPPTIS